MLYQRLKSNVDIKAGSIPIMLNEVAYRLWAEANERPGQYYFYSSRAELVAAVWLHPQLIRNAPLVNNKEVLYCEFPELKRRDKSTNWEYGGQAERMSIMKTIFDHVKKSPDLSFWRGHIGCFTDVESLFL